MKDIKVFESSIIKSASATAYGIGDVISNVGTDAHFTFGVTSANEDIVTAGQDAIIRKDSGNRNFRLNWLQMFISEIPTTDLDGKLFIFHTDIPEVADNAAFVLTDVQLIGSLLAVIELPVADWVDGAANTTIDIRNIDMDLVLPLDTTGQLFAQLVCANAYDPSGNSAVHTIRLGIDRG